MAPHTLRAKTLCRPNAFACPHTYTFASLAIASQPAQTAHGPGLHLHLGSQMELIAGGMMLIFGAMNLVLGSVVAVKLKKLRRALNGPRAQSWPRLADGSAADEQWQRQRDGQQWCEGHPDRSRGGSCCTRLFPAEGPHGESLRLSACASQSTSSQMSILALADEYSGMRTLATWRCRRTRTIAEFESAGVRWVRRRKAKGKRFPLANAHRSTHTAHEGQSQ